MACDFKFGDYVVYTYPTSGREEIGRFVATANNDDAFVCYSLGCTAEATDIEQLRLASENEIEELTTQQRKKQIGFHRFDAFCPQYDPDDCSFCRAAD